MKELIRELKALAIQEKVNLWKRIADDLEKPTRKRRVVNVSRIDHNAKEGETVVVPGKVLGDGDMKHNLTVAAFDFSEGAKHLIEKNGKTMTIREMMKSNPKGSNVRVIG